ncbi:Valyl-tRNA synthetase [Escherichia coli]|nr:Valyl-tRNA synthetase [Escherichia coli]
MITITKERLLTIKQWRETYGPDSNVVLPAEEAEELARSWISCSDRMPEDTKMLLAFSQGEIVAAYWNWVVNPIDYKKYRAFTYLSGNILDDVTHWMPLPEPPL